MVLSTAIVVVLWIAVYVPESGKIRSDFEVYLEQEGEDQIANSVGDSLRP